MAVLLLALAALGALPAALFAQAGKEIATTAVVGFRDRSGRDSALLQGNAMDAVALALSDSKEFLVTPTGDVTREMRALSLTPPLSLAEAVRLGRRLSVDSVALGEILQASVNQRSGSAAVRLQIGLIDTQAEELLDGAVVGIETKALPGWEGREADVLNEALREAAETGVAKMLAARVPRGTIEAVVASGACEINLGSQDGVLAGMKMVVMRPVYLRDLEKLVLRKIGYVEVSDIQADICYASPVKAVAPRTGDLVLRVYEPLTEQTKTAAKTRRKDFVVIASAVALLGALITIATGGTATSAPPTPISFLSQSAISDTPVIRIRFGKPDTAHAHLLFRGQFSGFVADAPYLVETSGPPNGDEKLAFIDDVPQFIAEQTRTFTVNFLDQTGERVTETVDATWDHPALDAGLTYYHKIRRVTDPELPPGSNPPQGTQSVRPQQTITNTLEQSSEFPMIGRATVVTGPVTYIEPVTLVGPPETDIQDAEGPIDFEFTQTIGADEYMVEVFANADGTDTRLRRTGIRPPGSGNVIVTFENLSGELDPDTTYFWRAGARRSSNIMGSRGQGVPQVGFGSNVTSGYVLAGKDVGVMMSFKTAPGPPIPPSSSSVARKPGARRPGPVAGAEGPEVQPPDRRAGARQPAPGARAGAGKRGRPGAAAARPARAARVPR